jgi:hypothetical protein
MKWHLCQHTLSAEIFSVMAENNYFELLSTTCILVGNIKPQNCVKDASLQKEKKIHTNMWNVCSTRSEWFLFLKTKKKKKIKIKAQFYTINKINTPQLFIFRNKSQHITESNTAL